MKTPFLSFFLFLTVALSAQKDSCDCFNLRPLPDHFSLGGRFAVYTQYESEKAFTGVCRTYFVDQASQTRDLDRTFMYGTFVQGEMIGFIQYNEDGDTTSFYKRERRDSIIAEHRRYNYRTGKLEVLERYYYSGREKKMRSYVYDERGILRIESNYFFPRKGDSLNYSGSFTNYREDSQLGSDGFYNYPVQEGPYLAYGGVNGERIIVKGAYHHNYKSGTWTIWYDSGQRKSEGAYSQYNWMDGNWKEWYGNGQLKSDIDYRNSNPNGKWNEWYENGQMKSNGMYVNFKREGEFVTWWENGKMKSRDKYKEGNILVMESWHNNGQLASSSRYTQTGQAYGEHKHWFPNGVLSEEHIYADGKPNGPAKWYYPNGKLMHIIEYANGQRVLEREYYENGKLRSEEHYANQQKTGRWLYYTQAGIPEWQENYAANQREGPAVYYSPNGEVKAELNFHQDEWNGLCKWYYPGGKLWREGTYEKGIRHGSFKEWNAKGGL
ncbi:MAG TPA: hypothetical protein VK826_01965, partial [Bacteroidia bacterium]|nr:hypothetical protein [Bacteroidia bacterium]